MANPGTLGLPQNARPRKNPYFGTIQPFYVSSGSRVNKGDAVSFVNGGVQTGGFVSYGALQTAFTFQTNSIGEMDIDVQDDFFIIAYYDVTATTLKFICGQVSINDQISYGTATSGVANLVELVNVKFIGTNTFVCGYYDATGTNQRAVAGTINRVTKAVTLGSPVTTFAYNGNYSEAVCKMSDMTFCMVGTLANPTHYVIAGTVSGTTITLGSSVAIGAVNTAGVCGRFTLTQVDNNKALAVFTDNSIIKAAGISVSGTTITVRAAAQYEGNNRFLSGVYGVDKDQGYLIANTGATAQGLIAYHGLISVSGLATATIGSNYNATYFLQSASNFEFKVGVKFVRVTDGQGYVVFYGPDGTTGIRATPVYFGKAGTAIAEYTGDTPGISNLVATANINCSVAALNSNRLIIIYGNGTTNAQAAVYRVSQGAPVGIAVEQGESFGEVRVLTDGEISAGFGNLPLQFIPGADYFVDSSNNVSANPNPLNAWIGTAINERWLAVGNRATLYRR